MMSSLVMFDSIVAVLALLVGVLLHKWFNDRRVGEAGAVARRIVEQAERDAQATKRTAELESKEAALKLRTEIEADARRRDREVQQIEQRVLAKEEELARKLDQMERRLGELTDKDRALTTREKGLVDKEQRVAAAAEEQRRRLEAIAGLTAEEARRQVLAQVEEDARREAALLGMRLEEEAREVARDKAREVLATTIQRLAPDYTVETAVSVVDLPSDDMKGRIIGREGRNIRALEQHTGVDLIVDDTPEAVLISAYDPYRREIARLALQRLVADGRIHPARIGRSSTRSSRRWTCTSRRKATAPASRWTSTGCIRSWSSWSDG
jgi:ribonuclease Y